MHDVRNRLKIDPVTDTLLFQAANYFFDECLGWHHVRDGQQRKTNGQPPINNAQPVLQA